MSANQTQPIITREKDLKDQQDVVQDVAEINSSHVADLDPAGAVAHHGEGATVVAQGGDDAGDGREGALEHGQLAGDDVEVLRLFDDGIGEDIELELGNGVLVGADDGETQVDNSINDRLHHHTRIARGSQESRLGKEAGEDGRLDVVTRDLEEGDDGAVGGQEDGYLLDVDDLAEGGQAGVGLHVGDAFGIGTAKGALQGAHAVVVVLVERYVLGIVGRRGGLLFGCEDPLPEGDGLGVVGGGPVSLVGFFVEKFQQGKDNFLALVAVERGGGVVGVCTEGMIGVPNSLSDREKEKGGKGKKKMREKRHTTRISAGYRHSRPKGLRELVGQHQSGPTKKGQSELPRLWKL